MNGDTKGEIASSYISRDPEPIQLGDQGLKSNMGGLSFFRWTEVQLPLLKQGAATERQAGQLLKEWARFLRLVVGDR